MPNSTGMGLPDSATGTSRIARRGEAGFGGFGASSMPMTVVMTQIAICTHMVLPSDDGIPGEGFLAGIQGNPPKLRLLPNLDWQVANVRSQPAKASNATPTASPWQHGRERDGVA